ncbi:hypothetical protein IF1G_06261 [Cordyceps javanica]|uniref:Uncharacterized protein n=1 Tax=Cordyceps javanica TaxID=43265 RepID=A0A545V0M6_9HYPO|nr:hypothetical protein IF1G_06261 [Cordyceps javanica]
MWRHFDRALNVQQRASGINSGTATRREIGRAPLLLFLSFYTACSSPSLLLRTVYKNRKESNSSQEMDKNRWK